MDKNSIHNPCELDGFAFLEFSGPDPSIFHNLFISMGFQAVARHSQQDIILYRQNEIKFIVNNCTNSQAQQHWNTHGPGACAMGFLVKDAKKAYAYAIEHGAKSFVDSEKSNHELLGIEAIGGSVIFFVDQAAQPFASNMQLTTTSAVSNVGNGLTIIDHLTHNVYRGNMDKWAHFYESIFNFKEIRYFDINGKVTGLISRALASPCGKIKIPLNESKDDYSQIEEFLHEFHGEGIQHIALSTNNIYTTVHSLRANKLKFLDVPDTYYEMVHERLPWHKEPLALLEQEKILIDGEKIPESGLLLQIFTENIFGPVFFEIIQRHGNHGFGEGNFGALFEAIERDQMRRGTLMADHNS